MDLKHTNICFTDLEPDDMLALWILPNELKAMRWIFIVGEGDPVYKYERMRQILDDKQMGFSKYHPSNYHQILVGFQSNKDHPGEKPIEERTGINYPSKENIINNTKTALAEVERTNGLGFMLKPATEMFQMYLDGNNVNYNIPWVWYGSFNLRSLIYRYNKTAKIVNCFVDAVGFNLIHESYLATGNQNSINDKEVNMNLLPQCIRDYIIVWNKYMADDCIQSINEIVRKQNPMFTYKDIETTSSFVGNEDAFFKNERHRNYYHRNFKCLIDIVKSNYQQFIFADVALILVFRLRYYGNKDLSFVRKGKYHMLESGYSSFVPLPRDTRVTDTRTYHYVDGLNETGRKGIRECLVSYLNSIMTPQLK